MLEIKKTIYVAGPMLGKQFFNFPEFDKGRSHLEELGYTVISPADLDREAGFDPSSLAHNHDWSDIDSIGFSLSDAIDRDLAAIRKCDGIYMLRGWQSSKGAVAERALAEWMQLEIIYQEEEDILEEALRITKGDRNALYGPPDQDFQRTAAMWSAMKGVKFEAREVALFMIALKLSRETHQKKRDNPVDIAGYARCLDICNRAAGNY